jgi:hypothetical protein
MNDLIEKLAKQAFGSTIDTDPILVYEAEKFAELIVRECVSTLNVMHLWQSVNNQNYPGVWHDAVDQSIDTIKEHFGVEE